VSRTTLLAICAAAASLVTGCSETRIAGSGGGIAPPPAQPAERAAAAAPQAPIGQHFASAALDDHGLGQVRGGLSTGSGMVVNFSFQEATYVNHNLTQSIVVPTLTVMPGANGAAVTGGAVVGGGGNVSAGVTVPIGNVANHVQVSTPAMAVQSIVNSGMTSVVSSLGGGGVTNTISNTANNQLVQQVITANIGVNGLSQTMQQSVASTVLSRVTAANSQFR
jgi:hypothetical protein